MCANKKPVGVKDFKIMRACSTEYNTKIQEALLIKKCNPKTELTVVCKWFVIFVECILTRFYLFIYVLFFFFFFFSNVCVTLLISFRCYVMLLLHAV